MSTSSSAHKLQILGAIFMAVVIAVVIHTHQLIIPIFLGLLSWAKVWGKVWLKSLTPKLGALLFKNSLMLQLRKLAMRVSAHLFVKSHKPWRRFLTRMRLAIASFLTRLFTAYLDLPLWMRTALAIAVLIVTAGSSFAVFALLIIPQPLLDWLRVRIASLLNSLGVTKVLSAIGRWIVPAGLRHRWYMYVKWTLGRMQVNAAKRVHSRVVQTAPPKDQGPVDGATDAV